MASSERTYDRARLRARQASHRLGAELRSARISAGRSQEEVARAARISQTEVGRIERGVHPHVALETLMIIGATVGLDLVANTFAGPGVIRDAPQVGLLGGFRDRLGPAWGWRYEVLVRAGDQRAWDAVLRHRTTQATLVVEAETRIHDIQALLRRTASKREAAGGVRVVLLVAATRRNREAIAAARELLDAEFPCPVRTALRSLASGLCPDRDALIVQGPRRAQSSHD